MTNLCDLARQAAELVTDIYVIGVQLKKNKLTQEVIIEYKNQTRSIICRHDILSASAKKNLAYLVDQFQQVKAHIDLSSSE